MSEPRKDDQAKLRYDLLPAEALEQVAHVFTIGATKYSGRNWEGGIEYGRCFGALMRHAWAWWRRETFDQKDGQHHLASVAFYALALLQYECVGPRMDDRPERKENAFQIDQDL